MKVENPLISVVVPVFNVAQYLRRCVDSLLAQTFRDFEIILVDDGSTDGSGNICDEYDLHIGQLDDISIRVIHQANAGVSAARNRGIEAARGKYISFIDADDWVEEHFLEAFFNRNENVDKKTPDIVVQGYVDRDGTKRHHQDEEVNSFNAICEKFFELEQCYLMGAIWNKLFCKEIIINNNVRFNQKLTVGEDMLFILTYLLYCQTLAVRDSFFYHYSENSMSITRQDYPFSIWRTHYDEFNEVLNIFQTRNCHFVETYRARRYISSIRILCDSYKQPNADEERLAFIRDLRHEMSSNTQISFKNRPLIEQVVSKIVLHQPVRIVNYMLSVLYSIRKTLHL